MALGRGRFLFRRRERDGIGFGGFARPERSSGTRGLGDQAGIDQPLQRLVRGALDDFQTHRRKWIRLAEVFLVQRAEFLAPLGGIAVHHQVKNRMRTVVRITLFTAEQRAIDAPVRFFGETARPVGRQR